MLQPPDFAALIVASTKPGQKAQVEVWRSHTSKTLDVVVGEFSADENASVGSSDTPTEEGLGLVLGDLPTDQKDQLGVTDGVRVEPATSPAARAGIRRGDAIVAVDQETASTARQAQQLFSQKPAGSTIALLVRRGNRSMYIALKPDKR